jgi:hypothetical protein
LKVILNKLTNYQGKVLNIGDTADVELRVADRWIKLGLAHLPAQGGIVPNNFVGALPTIDEGLILNSKQQEALIKFTEKIVLPEETIFREPEIIESDLEFEKLPEVTEENKDEIKTYKPKKRAKKKINESNS